MNNKQHININLSNLTLVIPAKEEPDCLYKVLDELHNFDLHKIVIIPSNRSLPTNWKFKNLKIINQAKMVMEMQY